MQIRAAAMQPLLPLIERLSLYPAETLLAVPAPPDAALRGVLVLQGLSRQMEIETEALRRDQAAVDAAAAALRQAAPQLARPRPRRNAKRMRWIRRSPARMPNRRRPKPRQIRPPARPRTRPPAWTICGPR